MISKRWFFTLVGVFLGTMVTSTMLTNPGRSVEYMGAIGAFLCDVALGVLIASAVTYAAWNDESPSGF